MEKQRRYVAMLAIAGAFVSFAPTFAQAASSLPYDFARSIIMSFYDAQNRDVDILLKQNTSPDWVSCSSDATCTPRDQILQRLKEQKKAIPDLKWTVQDVFLSN